MNKYKLLKDDTITIDGRTLYRIQAIRNFPIVKKGTLGGYIEKEGNLSHKGYCWVFAGARIFDDAKVLNNARVFDRSHVYGNAWVFNNAHVYGNAQVYENAEVYEDAQVFGNSRIYGNAWVFDRSQVYGNARIYGKTRIYGNSTVKNAELSDAWYKDYQWYYDTPLYKAMYNV